MGLCKCPKRQITTQFCFEHRVNVCEFCMVTSHPKCVVQSYIQWLKDSDFDSSCGICGGTLENGECVRLICYHVFHWQCLNKRQSALPANTAPGGHTCPTCSHPIFPPPNLISPVADVVRNRLGQVNWGRNELGLPLLSGEPIVQPIVPSVPETTIVHCKVSDSDKNKINGSFYKSNSSDMNSSQLSNPHSVLLIDSNNQQSSDLHANSRRPLISRQSPIGSVDRDDNKYKRRTPAEIFSRWSRRFYAPSSRPPWRRTWFTVLMGILTFVLVIYLLAAFGRSGSSDSEWDVHQNPNPKHYE